eukprot:s1186_g14.t1
MKGSFTFGQIFNHEPSVRLIFSSWQKIKRLDPIGSGIVALQLNLQLGQSGSRHSIRMTNGPRVQGFTVGVIPKGMAELARLPQEWPKYRRQLVVEERAGKLNKLSTFWPKKWVFSGAFETTHPHNNRRNSCIFLGNFL